MNKAISSVVTALQSNGPVSAEEVLRWMRDGELRVRGAAYHFLQRARDRIVPPLSIAEQCSFMLDYLFECLLVHPQPGDYLHSGFEAARELAAWVNQLECSGENDGYIRYIIQRLTEAYIAADDATRHRIETGAVEHMMESPSMRKYFASWKDDPTLGTAYKMCIQWGRDHEA